jgi:hypothetical protein
MARSSLDEVTSHLNPTETFPSSPVVSKARQQRRDAATSAALHHPVSAVDLRRAEDQMRRSRERVNRGDSYRIGGRADAPADWQQSTEQHQNREYVQRGNAKRRRRSNGDADNV